MSDLFDALAIATRDQRRATTPGHSAWVEANAGTGKTKVLTDRVMRLLPDSGAIEAHPRRTSYAGPGPERVSIVP
jgi:ATP-dependent helicase/nuclease subunit A